MQWQFCGKSLTFGFSDEDKSLTCSLQADWHYPIPYQMASIDEMPVDAAIKIASLPLVVDFIRDGDIAEAEIIFQGEIHPFLKAALDRGPLFSKVGVFQEKVFISVFSTDEILNRAFKLFELFCVSNGDRSIQGFLGGSFICSSGPIDKSFNLEKFLTGKQFIYSRKFPSLSLLVNKKSPKPDVERLIMHGIRDQI